MHSETCDWITGVDGGLTCTCGWNDRCDNRLAYLETNVRRYTAADIYTGHQGRMI
jgi:hypothetical protein